MASVLACIVLGALLVAAGALKLADPAGTRTALAGTYGIRRPKLAFGLLVGGEIGLGGLVGAGVELAALAAAGLFAGFATAQAWAIRSGRTGAPCACFGARGRVGQGSLARASLLGIALALLPLLPRRTLTTEEWLGVGLAVAALAVAGLAVVVLALAREVGALKLRLGPQGALEVGHEGPEVGARTALAAAFSGAEDRVALAVFSSEGCGLCRALDPAVQALGRDRLVELREFDEVHDSEAWTVADVPGSPFAVALDADGTVLAKGTFNSGGQLESIVAAALRRRETARA